MKKLTISEKLKDKIIWEIKSNPYQIFWDTNDKLSNEHIQQIINGGQKQVEAELTEDIHNELTPYKKILTPNKSVEEKFLDEFRNENKNPKITEDEFFNFLNKKENVYSYTTLQKNLNDLYRNHTNINIQVSIIAPNNDYYIHADKKNPYVNDIAKLLKLEPKQIMESINEQNKASYSDKKPNQKKLHPKNEKALVDTKEFAEELLNTTTTKNRFVIVAKADLRDFINKKPTHIIIPKGNYVGFFDPWNGAGSSIETPLKEDIEIPLEKNGKPFAEIIFDGSERIAIDDVYGVSEKFWGKYATIITK